MKKAITVLMAVALVFGFAGMVTAEEGPTCLDPISINRACETEQQDCVPFDYENIKVFTDTEGDVLNYCTSPPGKGTPKVLFPVCDCSWADELGTGDVVDIRLEILVNGERGNNGAYWAQNVDANGIYANSATSEDSRYDDTSLPIEDWVCSDPDDTYGIGLKTGASDEVACAGTCFGSAFVGDFVYKGVNENGNAIQTTSLSNPGACDTDSRYTIIEPATDQFDGEHGYEIQEDDTTLNASTWAIDIPYIWFDSSMIDEGDVISVEVCLTPEDEEGQVDTGSICGSCGCCYEFVLGEIECCEAGAAYSLIFPYATPMDDANWWYGMVITNESAKEGTATISVYETNNDNEATDTDSIQVPVDAYGMYVVTNQELMEEFGAGIGDERAYFKVETDFSASGFMFIGNDGKGEAMGYLPQ